MLRALNSLQFAFCGRAGDGSLTTGSTLAGIAKTLGVCPHIQRSVESNIKTEPTEILLRVANESIYSPSDFLDVVVVFDQSAVEDEEREGRTLPIERMRPGGILICDSSKRFEYPNNKHEIELRVAKRIIESLNLQVLGIPMAETVTARFGRDAYISRNSVSIGVIAELFGLPDETCRVQFEKEHGSRKEALEWNLGAYQFGREYVREKGWKPEKQKFPASAGVRPEDQLVLGGDAIGAGAIMGGCRFYAGYPITPASEVLEYMVKNMPTDGVVAALQRKSRTPEEKAVWEQLKVSYGAAIQEMSEVRAINVLLGAAGVGVRAMTATSGPGFALMQEGYSAAGISETPFVIVLSQRGGPGTGLPTRTGQEDLLFAVFGGHGEFPRIIISPRNAEEAFEFATKAFNLAEKYQCPVVLLTEQAVAQGLFWSKPFDPTSVVIDRGKLITPNVLDALRVMEIPFERYRITEDGISPRSVPGMRFGEHLNSTNEHDEIGKANESIRNRIAMTHKRMKKLEAVRRDEHLPHSIELRDSKLEIGFITFGFPTNATLEALEVLRAYGMRCSLLQVRTLWPFPKDRVGHFIEDHEKIYVVEQNVTGQLARLIRMETSPLGVKTPEAKLRGIRRYDGRPITAEDIVRGVAEGGMP